MSLAWLLCWRDHRNFNDIWNELDFLLLSFLFCLWFKLGWSLAEQIVNYYGRLVFLKQNELFTNHKLVQHDFSWLSERYVDKMFQIEQQQEVPNLCGTLGKGCFLGSLTLTLPCVLSCFRNIGCTKCCWIEPFLIFIPYDQLALSIILASTDRALFHNTIYRRMVTIGLWMSHCG